MKSSPPLLWWSSYKYRFVPWLALNLRSELAKQAARRAAAEEVRAAVGIGPEEDRKRLDKLAELCRNFQRPDPTLVFRSPLYLPFSFYSLSSQFHFFLLF